MLVLTYYVLVRIDVYVAVLGRGKCFIVLKKRKSGEGEGSMLEEEGFFFSLPPVVGCIHCSSLCPTRCGPILFIIFAFSLLPVVFSLSPSSSRCILSYVLFSSFRTRLLNNILLNTCGIYFF